MSSKSGSPVTNRRHFTRVPADRRVLVEEVISKAMSPRYISVISLLGAQARHTLSPAVSSYTPRVSPEAKPLSALSPL